MCFSVLSYGHDALLLTTRDLLLSHEGFHVLTATNRTEALRLLAAQNIDLLLLCHSLNEQEFGNILSAVSTLPRPPQVLALTATGRAINAAGYAVLNTFEGPGTFLAAVRGLIDGAGASLSTRQFMEPGCLD